MNDLLATESVGVLRPDCYRPWMRMHGGRVNPAAVLLVPPDKLYTFLSERMPKYATTDDEGLYIPDMYPNFRRTPFYLLPCPHIGPALARPAGMTRLYYFIFVDPLDAIYEHGRLVSTTDYEWERMARLLSSTPTQEAPPVPTMWTFKMNMLIPPSERHPGPRPRVPSISSSSSSSLPSPSMASEDKTLETALMCYFLENEDK